MMEKSREALISAVSTLFLLQPENTCQPTYVAPLIMVYTGTLSTADLQIFGIFRIFESQRRVSSGSILLKWTPVRGLAPDGILNLITNLDSTRIFYLCLSFPHWRGLKEASHAQKGDGGEYSYDPLLLLLLFAQVFYLDKEKVASTDWVQIFRTNIFGVIICSLSSRDEGLRLLARTLIGGLIHRIGVG